MKKPIKLTICAALVAATVFAFCGCKKPEVPDIPTFAPSVVVSSVPSVEREPDVSVQPVPETAFSVYRRAVRYLNEAPYYRIEGGGDVVNSLSVQSTKSIFEKEGNTSYFLAISTGFVKKATEITASGEKVTVRTGGLKGGQPDYDKTTEYTDESFSREWGGSALEPWAFDISESTALYWEMKDTETGRELSFVLDVETGLTEYLKRMQKNGDINEPKFLYFDITFTLDKTGRITEYTTHEIYDVKVLFSVSCEAKMKQTVVYEKPDGKEAL